jgi:hypothetical protein
MERTIATILLKVGLRASGPKVMPRSLEGTQRSPPWVQPSLNPAADYHRASGASPRLASGASTATAFAAAPRSVLKPKPDILAPMFIEHSSPIWNFCCSLRCVGKVSP